MMTPKPLQSRPANVISPPSIASAGVIAGIRWVAVPFGEPMGQLAIAPLSSLRGHARSTPRRSAHRASNTTGARPLIDASGQTRDEVPAIRLGGRRNFTNFGGFSASEISSMAVLLVATSAEQEHRSENTRAVQDRHSSAREQTLSGGVDHLAGRLRRIGESVDALACGGLDRVGQVQNAILDGLLREVPLARRLVGNGDVDRRGLQRSPARDVLRVDRVP